jgi:hypothetical protein
MISEGSFGIREQKNTTATAKAATVVFIMD